MKKKLLAAAAATTLLLAAPEVAGDYTDVENPRPLNKNEQLMFDSYMSGLHTMHALGGPTPPYICGYHILYSEFIYGVQHNFEALLDPLTPKQRKDAPLMLGLWWVVLDTLGCGDYDPTNFYNFVK